MFLVGFGLGSVVSMKMIVDETTKSTGALLMAVSELSKRVAKLEK